MIQNLFENSVYEEDRDPWGVGEWQEGNREENDEIIDMDDNIIMKLFLCMINIC